MYLRWLTLFLAPASAFVSRSSPRSTSLWAQEKFDQHELNLRIAESTVWLHDPPVGTPDEFYILMVSPGTDQQGVHTIQYDETGQNLVLAFEDLAACEHFAEKLRSEPQFVDPTPQFISLPSLSSFCQQLGVFAQFVPEGIDLEPPRSNVPKFGLRDPSLREKQRLLENLFDVEETAMCDEDDDGCLLDYNDSWE